MAICLDLLVYTRSSIRDALLILHLDLEADDITILDLALLEREPGLHELDHARFNFLDKRM